MSRWDWYEATVHGSSQDEVVAELVRGLDLVDVRAGRGMYGYAHGAEVVRGDRVLARVWWGGNPGVHVVGTGESAPDVAALLRRGRLRLRWEVLPTRVDACEDWVEEGLFDRLASGLISYAQEAGVSIDQQGDWVRGYGRTLYLGARSSVVRVRLYEKGCKEGGDPAWVRMEVMVRPRRHARAEVAGWSPDDAWGASRWLCEALARIGWDRLMVRSVGTVYRPSSDERARAALVRQYGPTLVRWAEEVGGWDALVFELRAAVESKGRSLVSA